MQTSHRLSFIALIVSLLFCPLTARAADMPVGAIVEETSSDANVALVAPDRLELICRSGAGTPWGFSFAGFETNWAKDGGPIELEVSGSGGYAPHDVFSVAALSVDFGRSSGGG